MPETDLPLWLSDVPQLGRRIMVSPQPLPAHLKPGLDEQHALIEQARQIVATWTQQAAAITALEIDLLETKRAVWHGEAEGKAARLRYVKLRRRVRALDAAQVEQGQLLEAVREEWRTLLQTSQALATRLTIAEATLEARTLHGRWQRFSSWVQSFFIRST